MVFPFKYAINRFTKNVTVALAPNVQRFYTLLTPVCQNHAL